MLDICELNIPYIELSSASTRVVLDSPAQYALTELVRAAVVVQLVRRRRWLTGSSWGEEVWKQARKEMKREKQRRKSCFLETGIENIIKNKLSKARIQTVMEGLEGYASQGRLKLRSTFNRWNSQSVSGFEMIEEKGGPELTQLQLNNIIDALLKIPRSHKLIHPCQERNRYSTILEWLTSAIAALRNSEETEPKELADKQQQLILSSLGEMIELTRKECQEKGVILQIVQQYFIGTINAYWTLFRNASRQSTYQYERNALVIEQQYMGQVKSLQSENQELKKDRDHRWRNMFMLIKDNRVHRKQNKKLIKSFQGEIQRSKGLAEQIVKLQLENEKLKMRIAALEGQDRVEGYIEACAELVQLEEKIKKYPKKSKKVLKNDLLKIEVGQTKNLQDKIQFIIRAIEETGQIVDEIYDETTVWSNFSYNISTQTDLKTEEKSVNTVSAKTVSVEVETHPRDHLDLDCIDTVLVKVLPQRKDKKETYRESKNVMFSTTINLGKLAYAKKENDIRSRHISKKDIRQYSLCESLKITIFQGRIAYISTYNSQIFNGVPTGTTFQVQKQPGHEQKPRGVHCIGSSTQTDHSSFEEPFCTNFSLPSKTAFKSSCFPKSLADIDLHKDSYKTLQIREQCDFFYDPERNKDKAKAKLSFSSEKSSDSLRSSVVLKRINKNQKRESKSDFRFAIKKVVKNEDKGSRIPSEENILEEQSEQSPREINILSKECGSPILAIKPTSEDVSEIMATQYLSSKPFANNQEVLNQLRNQKPPIKRNQSSLTPQNQLKMLQSHRLSKLTFQREGAPKHKRTTTEVDVRELSEQISDALDENSSPILQLKMKPLGRISEDGSEIGEEKVGNLRQRSKQKTSGLPFKIDKEGEFQFKGNDFSRGIEKIIKTMDLRYKELMHNGYTFKHYLSSHFKVIYGKELYLNFLNFLVSSSASLSQVDETVVCLNKLCNPKLHEGYSVDIFKTFAITVHKFLSINESPLLIRARPDILRYMVSQYLSEEEGKTFEVKMLRQSNFSFFGWFNCLQMEVRKGAIQSQLHSFLLDTLIESEDSISLSFIDEMTFFLSGEPQNFRQKIKGKFQLGQKILVHRFCLFCFKNQWGSVLNIQATLEQEYSCKLGTFNQQQCLKHILKHIQVLSEFKGLQKCFKYWLGLHKKYDSGISKYLLIMVELTILQFKLKTALPLSLDLRYLNLAFEGLQKKLFHEEMRAKMECYDKNHRSPTVA